MRYHWSLGIGHTYAHGIVTTGTPPVVIEGDEIGVNESMDIDKDLPAGNEPIAEAEDDGRDSEPDSEDPELTMEERENEDLGPAYQHDFDDFGPGDYSDDEIFEMYHM